MTITKEIAAKIYNCHAQIEEGQKMIETMQKEIAKNGNLDEIKDWTGSARGIEMGIPSGSGSHRILNVEPGLAINVIEAHIKNKQKDLRVLNDLARIQLARKKYS